MKVDKELSKGSHELILLKLLSRKDMYGYQLIQEMALLSEDVFHMSQGSLYPFLHALEDRGLIDSYAQAENGREAVDAFQKEEPYFFDAILMDMQMPVMDGCTASRAIRRLDREDAGSVVIYACTANTFQEDKDLALESGMDGFLTKPIDINILLKKIEIPGKRPEK